MLLDSVKTKMKNFIKKVIVKLKNFINRHPKIKMSVLKVLNNLPSLKMRLKKIGSNNTIDNKIEIGERTERGNEVYKNLSSKFKRLNKEKF